MTFDSQRECGWPARGPLIEFRGFSSNERKEIREGQHQGYLTGIDIKFSRLICKARGNAPCNLAVGWKNYGSRNRA